MLPSPPSRLPADVMDFHIQQLINNAPHAGENKPSVDALAELFASITGISVSFDINNWQDANLQSGVAISPVQAARCLQETVRTQVFLKGVMAAIRDKLQQNNRVDILYAGTGPYGLQVLPLLALLRHKQVSVTLIDIHPENIDALKKIIRAFNLEAYVKHIEVADATCWHPTTDESYDLIISETMNNLLRREPQLSIFCHLQQFLKEDGLLIPERIKIGAEIAHLEEAQTQGEHHPAAPSSKSYPPIDLGCFFQCDKHSMMALHHGDTSCLVGEIRLPDKINRSHYKTIRFTTTIHVYDDHQLSEGHSSLNMPICYHDLRLIAGASIGFEYLLTDDPRFVFDIPVEELSNKLPAIEDTGSLNIVHLKRLWHKSQLIRNNQLAEDIIQSEWPLDTQLLDLLDIPIEKTLEFLYQQQPEFPAFEQWVHNEAAEHALAAPEYINEQLLKNDAE